MFAENIGKEDQVDVQFEDKADAREEHFSARDIQGRFDLLRDLSDAEMEKLNKSVVKKIDWRMMPCVTIMFLMSYLERINVSNAMLAGLQEDLHMTDTVWNTGISTFCIGYLVGQLPGNLWLAKANPRWFLPSVMVAWSAATICMPAMTSDFLLDEGIGGTWDGIKEAVMDPFTWFFCLMHFALVTAQAFKDFLPSVSQTLDTEQDETQINTRAQHIVKTFNLGELTTYFIQAPPYASAYAFVCACAWSSGRRQESFWHIVIPIIGSMVGCAVLISTENIGARYFGLFLLISGTYNGLNLQLSWETTVVPAPRSKKVALIAIANCISQCSHWFSPYFWPSAHEPFYRLGGGLVLVGCVLVVVSAGLARWRAQKLNKKLDIAEGWSEHSGVERGWRFVH
ncbi:hypothetical protein BN1708_016014 [Verticillium longisporum]|uniref:Major facilitator superfamily (MFS) profile domain-containing protein n=1 Tax=Verticillium longisporum TaxID=100787 RepID=A0A0G4MC14_VERLO|nr:hypothetical protein BN1708_016014 [Verticillium longisporum]